MLIIVSLLNISYDITYYQIHKRDLFIMTYDWYDILIISQLS